MDELTRFARAFAQLQSDSDVHALSSTGPSALAKRIEGHLGVSPDGLPVVAQEIPASQLVDVQVALERWPHERQDRSLEVIGVAGHQRHFEAFSDMVAEHSGTELGAVDHVDVPDSPDSTRSCVRCGIFLLIDGKRRAAALVRGPDPLHGQNEARLETMSSDAGYGREILAELRRLAVEHSVLRGQVLSLGQGEGQLYGGLRFVRRP